MFTWAGSMLKCSPLIRLVIGFPLILGDWSAFAVFPQQPHALALQGYQLAGTAPYALTATVDVRFDGNVAPDCIANACDLYLIRFE